MEFVDKRIRVRLPQEILGIIFSYDNTYKEILKNEISLELWKNHWKLWSCYHVCNNSTFNKDETSELYKFTINALLHSKCHRLNNFRKKCLVSYNIEYTQCNNWTLQYNPEFNISSKAIFIRFDRYTLYFTIYEKVDLTCKSHKVGPIVYCDETRIIVLE
jgi:hypothetical protein